MIWVHLQETFLKLWTPQRQKSIVAYKGINNYIAVEYQIEVKAASHSNIGVKMHYTHIVFTQRSYKVLLPYLKKIALLYIMFENYGQ